MRRGPDSSGIWSDLEAGVFLTFRRLSIIDLSSDGHQPMVSRDGRHVIVFNGEIYNYLELKGELETSGVEFKGHSDTEVFLEGIAKWGISKTLSKSNGMFACAVWDRESLALTLARDRIGEKPLYYGWNGDNFYFASELKALRANPDFREKLSEEAVAQFLRF